MQDQPSENPLFCYSFTTSGSFATTSILRGLAKAYILFPPLKYSIRSEMPISIWVFQFDFKFVSVVLIASTFISYTLPIYK